MKKVETALARTFPGAEFRRYSTVSGKVSGELVRNGAIAIVLAILGIGLFAIFRFEWQFGVSTIVAIVHDLLMTLGFFALTQFEFDLNIVAAVLTIALKTGAWALTGSVGLLSDAAESMVNSVEGQAAPMYRQ